MRTGHEHDLGSHGVRDSKSVSHVLKEADSLPRFLFSTRHVLS